VERYRKLAGAFGAAVPLSAFGLSPEETARTFSDLDDDYHISRFLSFSKSQGTEYRVGGEDVTHVTISEGVLSLL